MEVEDKIWDRRRLGWAPDNRTSNKITRLTITLNTFPLAPRKNADWIDSELLNERRDVRDTAEERVRRRGGE
jgi:hypothetical protein